MMGEEENFRETQYYTMLKESLKAVHVTSKTAYHSNCTCTECQHTWRGECMKEKCGCCTTPLKDQ